MAKQKSNKTEAQNLYTIYRKEWRHLNTIYEVDLMFSEKEFQDYYSYSRRELAATGETIGKAALAKAIAREQMPMTKKQVTSFYENLNKLDPGNPDAAEFLNKIDEVKTQVSTNGQFGLKEFRKNAIKFRNLLAESGLSWNELLNS